MSASNLYKMTSVQCDNHRDVTIQFSDKCLKENVSYRVHVISGSLALEIAVQLLVDR